MKGYEMTGELLHLRFAAPCLLHLMMSGKVSKEHNSELFGAINEEGSRPRRKLLKHCFPRAFRRLRELAKNENRETWSYENVADYWRNRHREEEGFLGDCAVSEYQISQIEYQGLSNMFRGKNGTGPENTLVNMFDLSVSFGSRVRVHERVIVELMEEE